MPGSKLQRFRDNPVYAYVGPMVAFQVFISLVWLVKKTVPGLPWYRTAPEHWVYPLQTLVCGGLIAFWWKHYDWSRTNAKNLLIGAVCGIIGIAIWILPTEMYYRLGGDVADWMSWIGVRERDHGFDPNDVSWSLWTIILRVIRMAIVVAFVEELVWRGFLMRYLVDMDKPFTATPFGTHRWRVFGIVTALVVVIHQPADYAVAVIWGTLVYWVAVKTRSLAACVMMHGIANLILGLYILKTGHYGLW